MASPGARFSRSSNSTRGYQRGRAGNDNPSAAARPDRRGSVPALPGEPFEGTVRLINVAADPTTRTYMVRIRVPNPRYLLRVGMIAEAQIRGDRVLDAMTLPGESWYTIRRRHRRVCLLSRTEARVLEARRNRYGLRQGDSD